MVRVGNDKGSGGGPYAWAGALAKRLEAIGINPFQSQHDRYVVLLGGSAGEILEWGRPFRGTRIFGPNAIRKDKKTVKEFSEFARQDGLADCVFWCVGLTGAKAAIDDLDASMKEFNSRINIEFTELRKTKMFEVLLTAIHPRYDPNSGLFDLHAHFIARVPPVHRDAVKHRLRKKFSKTDFKDDPIRKAAAVVTYMLWGIFRNKIMTSWPDAALKAAWGLTERKFKFVRSSGSFSKWKSSRAPVMQNAVRPVDEKLRQTNRAETKDERLNLLNRDKLLSFIMIKIRGVKTPAMLYESANPVVKRVSEIVDHVAAGKYSSAANIATQGVAILAAPATKSFFSRLEASRILVGNRLCLVSKTIWRPLRQLIPPIIKFGRKLFRQLE